MFGSVGVFGVVFAVLFLAIFGLIIAVVVAGTRTWNRNNKAPVEILPVHVVAKRTHTTSGGSNSSSSTFYFATFELPTRERRELRVRPAEFGQLAEGDRGQLTMQGTRYLGFQRQYFPG